MLPSARQDEFWVVVTTVITSSASLSAVIVGLRPVEMNGSSAGLQQTDVQPLVPLESWNTNEEKFEACGRRKAAL